jgi:hypothetical protein
VILCGALQNGACLAKHSPARGRGAEPFEAVVAAHFIWTVSLVNFDKKPDKEYDSFDRHGASGTLAVYG